MANSNLEAIEKSMLPLLTFVKPTINRDESLEAPYGSDLEEIRHIIESHLISHVDFTKTTRNVID